jgi:hypothetical protein
VQDNLPNGLASLSVVAELSEIEDGIFCDEASSPAEPTLVNVRERIAA